MNGKRTRKHRLVSLGVFLLSAFLMVYVIVSIGLAGIVVLPGRQPLTTTPAAYGLPYEDVQFTSVGDGVPLAGWFIDSPGTRTVLVMHGSGSTRDNYINMEMARALAQASFDVFLFDFRGHGTSGGDRGSIGLWETRDVAGAIAYLKGRGITEVGSLGYSMGASAELLAAPENPEMRAIVADSAFADLFTILEIERSRRGIPPFFNEGAIVASKTLFGLDIFQNEPKRAIAKLGDRPVLLIHTEGDPLIPVSQAYELQQAGAGNPNLELWVVPAPGHVNAYATHTGEYVERVTAFFDRHLTGDR